MTRQQSVDAKRVPVYLTLDDIAKKLTRVSGSLHSIANLINDTIQGRPGFFQKFRRAGENSSANARALWRFHDARWREKRSEGDDNVDEEEEESSEDDDVEPIDDEVDRRIGQPFDFTRAVEVALGYLQVAKNALEERKREMRAWADEDGALFVQAFVEAYEREENTWAIIRQHLQMCSTHMGESILDTSLRHGWL